MVIGHRRYCSTLSGYYGSAGDLGKTLLTCVWGWSDTLYGGRGGNRTLCSGDAREHVQPLQALVELPYTVSYVLFR